MSYEITIHHSADTLEDIHWSASGLDLPASMDRNYLLLLERLHEDQMDTFYASITEKGSGQVIGLIYFQSIVFKGAYLKNFFRTDEHSGLLKRMLFGILGIFLDFMSWNLLLAGNIFYTGERGAYFRDSIPHANAAKLIHDSFLKVTGLLGKTVDGLMFNNVYNDGPDFIHHYLKQFKYGVYPVDPDMVINFRSSWESFDDYMGSLSSKYRVRLRKVLKDSEPISVRQLELNEIEALKDKIHELYLCTAENVDFNLGYLDRSYFTEMKRLCGGDFVFLGYFGPGDESQTLIGFMSLLVVDEEIDVNYMGMDYEYNREYKLYNRMLADLVRAGIEHGVDRMHLGRTATEIKSTIGAQARGMKIYLNSPSGWKARGIRIFQPYFGSPEYTLRHPFKDVAATP